MKLLKFLILGLILASCGPNYHLRRAEHHLKKAELKGAVVNNDTVWRTLEIPVPEVITDTVFESKQGDTVRIEKDRLSIKYVNLPGEKVYIEGKCEADTVTVKTYHTVTKTIKAGKGFWYYAWRFLGVAVLFFIAGYISRAVAARKVNISFNKEKE